jgi:hypothetical protein
VSFVVSFLQNDFSRVFHPTRIFPVIICFGARAYRPRLSGFCQLRYFLREQQQSCNGRGGGGESRSAPFSMVIISFNTRVSTANVPPKPNWFHNSHLMLSDCIVDVVGVLVYQSSWEREACWQEGEEIFFSRFGSRLALYIIGSALSTRSVRVQNCQKNC